MQTDRAVNLVADVGGTNTRVALADGARVRPASVRRYRNAEFAGLDAVLARFVAEAGGVVPHGVCAAVAGPVRDEVARLTNRDWTIDAALLARATGGTHCAILNDLSAQGHALGHLDAGGTRQLRAGTGTDDPLATRLVIGLGTGFNIAPVYAGPPRFVPAAEAGHALLPLRNAQDLSLAAHLARDHGVASIEDLLSGRGIAAAYDWAAGQSGAAPGMSGHDVMQSDAPAALRAREVMVRMMGVVFSDLAITLLPFGGIYLSGGVARAFADHIGGDVFGAAFRDKGRFSDFMDQFAIHVIEDDYAALTGCAAFLSSGA